MGNFFIGLMWIGAGGAMMYYALPISQIVGSWVWADTYVGGTRQLCLLIGFVLCVIGFSWMFGLLDTGSLDATQIQFGDIGIVK